MVGSVLLAALWIGLGRLHEFQNSDSIILTLISLQHWTPFYWSQDRYGMLVPLLVWPIRDPLFNLIAQAMIHALTSLLSIVLLTRYMLGKAPVWMAAALLMNAWVLLTVPRLIQFYWYLGQPQYSTALVLGLAALLVSNKVGQALLLVLACWVNVGIGLVLVPLTMIRGHARCAAMVVGASIVGGALMALTPHRATATGIEPLAAWPRAWWRLAVRAVEHVLPEPWSVSWLALPALVGIVAVRAVRRPAAALLGLALVYWLTVGTFTWVRLNDYTPSYVLPAMMLILATLAILAVAPLQRSRPALLSVGAALLLLVSAGFTSGKPSTRTVKRALDARFGAQTASVMATDAVGISGDYWSVWPVVYYANLVAYRHGLNRVFYGVGQRDEPTRGLWASHRIFHLEKSVMSSRAQ